eukprot:CAMPEP_0114167858 /NCGR_PEP_ID=MMETSP0043_2-20121206/32657_1 /TAXON_ID=464988 /ORGANISM="Hemiselmis andersenii, Strain CCMP644" /LENGTH=63 /DNA_ID=CAMNT_0001265077 /DNA_START=10 /DNA_END=198 /DNA_ORIENTATION=+
MPLLLRSLTNLASFCLTSSDLSSLHLRTQWLPESATKTAPLASTAKPAGQNNSHSSPFPSRCD